jgi:predicted outer membrane repeat protein
VTPTLRLTGSTVNGNAAADGGGIYLYYTSARLLNTTVSGNHSSHYGGGISTLSDFLRTIDLVNCTIYTNTTDSNGGGMQLESAFTVNLKNTIVAGNGASGIGPDIWGIIQSYDYNLIQDTSGATIEGTTTHNVTGSNPMLGPLANNGGRTWTHALLAGSPAINAGSCTGIAGTPITVDQRGVARISPCDIGAYEYVAQAYLPLVIRN